MFYAEVTDEMKVTSGGGNASEGECIDVVEMTIPEIRAYLKSDEPLSTSGFFYALTWFLTTKAPAFENKSTEAKKPT